MAAELAGFKRGREEVHPAPRSINADVQGINDPALVAQINDLISSSKRYEGAIASLTSRADSNRVSAPAV
eukprot:92367-Rhodomonas_salina.1